MWQRTYRLAYPALAGILLLGACKADEAPVAREEHGQEQEEEGHSEDRVTLTGKARETIALESVPVMLRPWRETLRATAVIKPNAYKLAHVSPRIAGLRYLRIIIKRDAIARYGINASQILDTVEAMGGRIAGEVLEGQRRFFMQVRFRPEDGNSFERIEEVRVADPSGRLIPISQLAELRAEEGPAQITRENTHRRLAVETNVRGRDLASFVADARRAVGDAVDLPTGYWIEWGGQFENLQRATARPARRSNGRWPPWSSAAW